MDLIQYSPETTDDVVNSEHPLEGAEDNRPINVLIIDDDVEFAQLVAEFLDREGDFAVTLEHEGRAGAASATAETYDVIVLDVGLPELNGFEVLKRIRRERETPVIMLTARGDDIDRILGLEIGADDYVPKPCNLRELIARIRAIIRRTRHRSNGETNDQIIVGDLKIESGSQSVYLGNELLPLTSAEYLVLDALIQARGEIVDKNMISRHALGRRIAPYDRSVDVHISNLRKKLGPLADGRQRIKTVRGQGYLFVATS